MSSRLLSVKNAAIYMDVHPMTVYRMIWNGELAAENLAKPGQRPWLRIKQSTLDAHIAGLKTVACTA